MQKLFIFCVLQFFAASKLMNLMNPKELKELYDKNLMDEFKDMPKKKKKKSSVTFINGMDRNYEWVYLMKIGENYVSDKKTAVRVKAGKQHKILGKVGDRWMIVENVVNSTTQQDMLAFTIQNKP